MSSEPLSVSVNLINEKVKFEGVVRDNPAITIDYIPPLGDGQGYMPLELLLVSLASCSGATVVSLLRKMSKNIISLKVNASGIRREQHPTSFEKIHLDFLVNSSDIEQTDIIKAIQLSEESYCPVWAMLKNNVDITFKYEITKTE